MRLLGRVRGVALACLLSSAACGEPDRITAPSRSGELAQVRGAVLDFRSSAGVPNVPLRFEVTIGGARRETRADASGGYAIALAAGDHGVFVDGTYAGLMVVGLGGGPIRGDLYARGGECIARYGAVIDDATSRPVAGATVAYAGHTATTGADGWYRIDHPCVGFVPGGTTGVQVSHPGYTSAFRVTGRGIGLVQRMDVELHAEGAR